jgi:MAF protein
MAGQVSIGGCAEGQLVLASASPRRVQLLAALGLRFDVLAADISEERKPQEPPAELARRLSLEKAWAVAAQRPADLVLACDTVVSLGWGAEAAVFGKPAGDDDLRRMLECLLGREHWVFTGYALVSRAAGLERCGWEAARVQLRRLGSEELEEYIRSGLGRDKAGAYAVQDTSFRLAKVLEGCAAAVMGLPLCALRRELLLLGLPVASTQAVARACAQLTGHPCCLEAELNHSGEVEALWQSSRSS